MDDSSIVKLVAILGLVVIEIVNLVLLQIDGVVMTFISSVIGGIAGYEYGKRKKR